MKNYDAATSRPEVVPELASSWERSEDGLTCTFHLQPGIEYQNIDPRSGRDFTAEDVKFAYERYATEGVGQTDVAARRAQFRVNNVD
ncbi:MAG: ABC transporter substrate-binding protein [Chloroflexi bacterium]|nr:ABC transporter substrate-binding protein [Chloroflexota bacterium]